MAQVIAPEDVEVFIQSIRKSRLEDVGSERWLDLHGTLLKLHQHGILEIASDCEELVKELMIQHDKASVLVHEANCILVWRKRIMPKLMQRNNNPPTTLKFYTAMYHEAISVALLELVLFHENSCQSLENVILDLIDYAVQAVSVLIGLVNAQLHEKFDKPNLEETTEQEISRIEREINFKIGTRCVTLLSYVANHLEVLPRSASLRMVSTHDVPVLMTEVLRCKPWIRRSADGMEKFNDEFVWEKMSHEDAIALSKTEAQTWLCMLQLLFNEIALSNYHSTDFRVERLQSCNKLLTEQIIDQVPPLIELKNLLNSMVLMGNNTSNKSLLVVEEVPQIQTDIIQEAEETGMDEVFDKQCKLFLSTDAQEIIELAKRLSDAYNTDYFDTPNAIKLATKTNHSCARCMKKAEKRCGECRQAFYCSKECQLQEWSTHKFTCNKPEVQILN